MKEHLRKYKWNYLITGLLVVISFTLLVVFIPRSQPLLVFSDKKENRKETIRYVAIGDSLTEGVGDGTNSGGFVSLLSEDLQKKYNLNEVQTDNFGKSGDRSDQIVKRIEESKDIQKAITEADIITLTVGGNDLMKVVKREALKMTVSSFEKPLKEYKKELENLFEVVRQYNEEAPIYVLGIYNPFYEYFPEIIEMQEIVGDWNRGTEEVVSKDRQAYFIPIDDLLSKRKSIKATETVKNKTEASKQKKIKNNVFYEKDHFHPNELGYKILEGAIKGELGGTTNHWLAKTEE